MARDFYRVECRECGNQQNVFSRASKEVSCLVCGEKVAQPTGGKAEFSGEIVQELQAE